MGDADEGAESFSLPLMILGDSEIKHCMQENPAQISKANMCLYTVLLSPTSDCEAADFRETSAPYSRTVGA